MRKYVFAALFALLSVPAFALAQSPSQVCTAPATQDTVVKIIHAQLIPQPYRDQITARSFKEASKLVQVNPAGYDRANRIMQCRAKLSVNAAKGMDHDIDVGLQYMSARYPDLLFTMDARFEGPDGQRRYLSEIQYEVQEVGGETMVRVTSPSELDITVIVGVMLNRQNIAAPVAKPALVAAKADPVINDAPAGASFEDFTKADAAMGAAYKAAMNRLAPGRQSLLKTDQLAWVRARDKACSGYANEMPCLIEQSEARAADIKRFN